MHFRPSPRYAGQSARRPRVRVGQPDRRAELYRILCPNLRNADRNPRFRMTGLRAQSWRIFAGPKVEKRCREKQRTVPLGPKAARVYRCQSCGYRFSVTSGTLLDHSRVPLHKWWIAAGMIGEDHKCAATQLQRSLKVTYKTAWFMRERLRMAWVLAKSQGWL